MAQRAHIDYTHGPRRSIVCSRREDGEEKFGEIEVTCHHMSRDVIRLCKVYLTAYLEHWFQTASRSPGL